MFPDALTEPLQPLLGDPVRDCATVGGGSIANACRLETTDGRAFFLKWGAEEVARTFPGEAAGLKALRAAESPIRVPEVVAVEAARGARPGFLLMSWIDSGRQRGGFWERFGRGLAALHRSTAKRYGFSQDNYIGRLPQENTWEAAWPTFFRAHRLAPQVERAREEGHWRQAWDAPLETLYRRLDDLLPRQPEASLLHGDLWSGNFMVTILGAPVLIDPAVYHGHREADLAMTELFGGFASAFYDAYREAWPLEAGYEERRGIYNLYHLINHLNHFGRSYAGRVDAILRTFR